MSGGYNLRLHNPLTFCLSAANLQQILLKAVIHQARIVHSHKINMAYK